MAAQIVRNTMGTSLIGAKGVDRKHQERIDETMVGPCLIGAFSKDECRRHQK